MTARILNSTLHDELDHLEPLVNPQTNAPIANLPASTATLTVLPCKLYSHLDICTLEYVFY
jgi:hypothetical protein